MVSVYTPTDNAWRAGAGVAILGVSAWGVFVASAAGLGWLAAVPPLGVASLVATGIVAPALLYFFWPPLRAFLDRLGLRAVTAFHAWRIPAAMLFFWYGAQGQLPLVFVLLAGVGDFMAGVLALWAVLSRQERVRYWIAHIFGLIDFIIAVGTGVTLTLLMHPLMTSIRDLPLALIPYFGVGLSGATHMIAFAMLRRGA